MSRFPRRGRLAGLALGLVALGVPLVGASSASAAMGTSPTFVPQNRPALVSVTDQGGTGLVNFCFGTSGGQAVVPEPPPGGTGAYDPNDFALGGYDDGNVQPAATVSQLNNNCVQATFALGEIGEYTYGTVNDSAVVAIIAGNPVGNLQDSAPLIGSSSNNGTRGFTTGLDLVNVLSPGSNRLAFVFDQDVREDNLSAGCPGADCITDNFLYYDGGGNLHGRGGAAIISISGNVVVVQYQNPPDPVADARIGLVQDHAFAVEDPGGANIFNPIRADTPGLHSTRTSVGSVGVAGAAGSGNTADIEATGAALVNNGNSNQINFTFENNVATGAGFDPDCFVAVTSNNNQLNGDAASITDNVVTVTFNGMQNISEMIVRAGIQTPDPGGVFDPGFGTLNCVQSATGAVPNTMAGLPVGGNVGAVATGYTVGPEALAGATFSGGNVTVPVDQRVDPASFGFGTLNQVVLLDDQGNPIGGPPSAASVTGNGSPTDPHAVTFTFDPVAVSAARGLQLLGAPWSGSALWTFPFPGGVDNFFTQHNVTQVFAR
jgi:hypothetical protein